MNAGRQLNEGLRAISSWLAGGGKLFVRATTPPQKPFEAFIRENERRVTAGAMWPGWVEKLAEFSNHRQLGQMPGAIHLPVLVRLCAENGLRMESIEPHRRPDLPVSLQLDGREPVALVACAD